MKILDYLENEPEYVQAVAGFMIDGDKVLLGLRKKVSNNLGENQYAGIGGKIEEGESADNCLIREFKEEIEVDLVKFEKMGRARFLNPFNPQWNMAVDYFVVSEWMDEPKETEVIKPVWFNKEAIPFDQMFRDNKYWLPNLLKAEHFDGIFLYGEDHEVADYRLEIIDKD